MNWNGYMDLTHEIVNSKNPQPPYDDSNFHHYTIMNETRMNRWLKVNPITNETASIVAAIEKPQTWVVITEPWCGDAAHIVPILYLMSTLNDKITFRLQLRDSDSEIEKYLTNGKKAIPILIVRDEAGNDLFSWGPRPADGQEVYDTLAAQKADVEEIKSAIQVFYNNNKSLSTQQEVADRLKAFVQ